MQSAWAGVGGFHGGPLILLDPMPSGSLLLVAWTCLCPRPDLVRSPVLELVCVCSLDAFLNSAGVHLEPTPQRRGRRPALWGSSTP